MSWMQYGLTNYEIGTNYAPGVTAVDIAHSLARINRFTGHSNRVISVARHSVFVSKLLEFNTWAALYGLVHDVHETVINDLSWPLKQSLSKACRDELKVIEEAADVALYEVLKVPHPIHEAFVKVVKRADWLAVATEKRDLMPKGDRVWDMLPCDPSHVRALPTMCPEEDALQWLERYCELTTHLGLLLDKPLT